MSRRRILIALATVVVLLAAVLFGLWFLVAPRQNPQPLPAALVALPDAEGRAILAGSDAAADYDDLAHAFRPQWLNSYCGVASGVAVLGALGKPVLQQAFFTSKAEQVRSMRRTVFGGMTLDDLAGLLAAHGAVATAHHADAETLESFRATMERNLATEGDYLVVNYDRAALGQIGAGHISPIAAWDAETDMVLVMDTAAHHYPQAWVPVADLFAAMNTPDSETGLMRGWVEVTGLATE